MRRALAVLAVVVSLHLACASSQTTGGIVAGQPQPRKGKVVILPVEDGKERDGNVVGGSGRAVTAALRDSLIARRIAPLVTEQTTLVEAVKEAKALSYDYVLKAVITEWEDNATEWSGRPDTAGLSVELYDLTPVLVSTVTHRKKGPSALRVRGTPDRFLPELVQSTLDRIFSETPSGDTPSAR